MANSDISRDNIFPSDEPEIFGNNASKVKLFSVTLDGIVTDFAISDYVNQTLIVITQFQKIGTLISVTKGGLRNLNGCDDIYEVKTLYGLDSQEYHTAARFLAHQLDISKPVLFSICLKDYQPRTLKALAKVLQENIFPIRV